MLLAHANSQKSDWKNRVQIQEIQDPNNYGSPEILPYISTKFSERATADDVEDKDKLLSLFTNTKREVDLRVRQINLLHGYFNATYNTIMRHRGLFSKLEYFMNLFHFT